MDDLRYWQVDSVPDLLVLHAHKSKAGAGAAAEGTACVKHVMKELRRHVAPSVGSHAGAGAALAALTAHPEETVRCAALAVLT